MEFPQLQVSFRNRTGKGPARRLRQQGRTPAILYGSKLKSLSLSVSPAELSKAISGPLHTNTVLDLSIADAPDEAVSACKAIVRDHQFDPVTRHLLHVDFVVVELDKKISVSVPLRWTGRSAGEQAGGKLAVVYRTLPVECLPEQIPEAIEVDVTHLQLNEAITVGEVTLPEGVSVTLPAQTSIVLIQSARAEEAAEEETDEEGAAEGEGEETAESTTEKQPS
ncbi:MAG: 50S ribosomal protein L25 [Myxococcota bacterium]|nr:50S ribosomal protein L25 [Myxococcota bacterium]